MTQTGFRTEKLLLCSKCLLSPPGDADWSPVPRQNERTNERASEQDNEWTSKREREKEKIGGGNRSKQGTSPPDAHWCRDRPKPLTWTHTQTPLRGPKPEGGEAKPGSWGQRSGVRQMALFLFCLLPEMTKKTTVWTRDWTTKTTGHLTGRLMARQTGRPDECITSCRGKSYLHETSKGIWILFIFGCLK